MKSLILFFLVSSSVWATPSIEGKWTTDCTPFGRHAIIATVEVKKDSYKIFAKLFERPGCAIHTVRSELDANYNTGEVFESGFKFDHTPKRIEMVLKKADVVHHYNKNKICGFDDWELGIYKSIERASGCVGFNPPELNTEYFDLFKFLERDLVFSWFPSLALNGDELKRPTSVSSNAIPFWKISDKSFNRVKRDIKIYDDYILSRKRWFSTIPSDINDKNWVKRNLEFMVEIDQYMRSYLSITYKDHYSEVEVKKFQKLSFEKFVELDKENTKELKKILKVYKWIKISEFGEIADSNAWLIVQHADHDPSFQKDVLSVLDKLWRKGETNPSNYAYLYDRVAASWSDLSKQKPQRYGTQGICKGPGKWEPITIEDPKNVDKRRAEVGLPPLKEYIEKFRDICK